MEVDRMEITPVYRTSAPVAHTPEHTLEVRLNKCATNLHSIVRFCRELAAELSDIKTALERCVSTPEDTTDLRSSGRNAARTQSEALKAQKQYGE
jgi:chaperonin cofactor prefoldin